MQAFFRSVFFIPTACSYVVASLIWKLSIFNGVNFGLANTVLDSSGTARLPADSGTPPVVLDSVGDAAPVAAGRLLYDPLSGRSAAHSRRVVRSGEDGRRKIRLADILEHHAAAAAGDRRRGAYPAAHRRYQAFDEFYNLLAMSTTPGRRWNTSINLTRQAQDYGHGSAGALIVALIIAVVTIGQARIFGFGKAGE